MDMKTRRTVSLLRGCLVSVVTVLGGCNYVTGNQPIDLYTPDLDKLSCRPPPRAAHPRFPLECLSTLQSVALCTRQHGFPRGSLLRGALLCLVRRRSGNYALKNRSRRLPCRVLSFMLLAFLLLSCPLPPANLL